MVGRKQRAQRKAKGFVFKIYFGIMKMYKII